MKPSPRYQMKTPSDTIAAQSKTIKEQRKEIEALKEVISRMTRHAEGIAAVRKELVSLLTGK